MASARMFVSSPYSPFFNSGLLARDPPRTRHHHARRSSLPSQSSSSRKSTSAYYRSLQRRDQDEHRSFLSLDLAESRLSERHLPQAASRGCSWLIPPVPALPPLPVVSPLKSHFPTESSPNPTMLPELPPPPYSIHHTHRRTPPRLPELPVLPALHCPLPTTKSRRPLPSPPSPVSPTDNDVPHPRSSVLTKPKHLRTKKPKNLAIITDSHRLSKASVSTASTRVRRRNRWDALDALEGRRKPSITTPPPFVPPVPNKKTIKFDNLFVKPTTFANSRRVLPNFMNLSDDSDPEPLDDSSSYSTDHDQTLPLDVDPLLEPEDIVLPAELNTRSYLDVEGADNEDEEEGVVLEAVRCPAPSSPPPPTIIQRTWNFKAPVEKPKHSIIPTKDKTLPASSSKHHHHPSTSSRRHKPSTSTAKPRNNHSHYKSFIDLDDLVDPKSVVKSSTVKRSEGGEWVWV